MPENAPDLSLLSEVVDNRVGTVAATPGEENKPESDKKIETQKPEVEQEEQKVEQSLPEDKKEDDSGTGEKISEDENIEISEEVS